MNRNSFLNSIPPICKNLLTINIILFIASYAFPAFLPRFGLNIQLSDLLGLHYWESPKFNPVQLISYSFIHAGFFHIFFNMLALFMFGRILEFVWGPKKFLIYYLITAVGAALVQEIVWTIEFHPALEALNQEIANNFVNASELIAQKNMFLNSPNFVTVGASGAVFGLLLAFGWLFPEQQIFIYFIPVKARIAVFIFGVMELFLGVANFSIDQVAHFAHLGGMLFGIVLILYWKKKNSM